MEPVQPADRVPADRTAGASTPPEGRPAADPGATPPDGQPPVAAADPAGGQPAPAAGGTADTGSAAGGTADPAPAAGGTADTDPDVPPATSAAAAREAARTADGRSPKDMAISLLVLLVPIALLLGFYRVFLGGDEPTTVDPAPVVTQARAANVFPVSEPVDLGSGWRTVSARYQPVDGGATLRLGYLSPDGRGVQLVQSSVDPEKLLPAELTREGQPQGTTQLGGRSWQRYTARSNEQALVLLEPNRTVIVVGAAREQELRELAGALR
ncbi:DUF4245 domain-containing protein [Micromonospora echinofusca]|uniref:DUF4245 family protein n=1 Tax=Micromonospora echinofusca TaxID=47858 RepID=A0ABS3VU96_MICEH|nr:DUF4245 domain-containing protein [Micromonospora echinofusca]MBO4208104.1 DUF4245 family protein [Micromonospora echinofusca]